MVAVRAATQQWAFRLAAQLSSSALSVLFVTYLTKMGDAICTRVMQSDARVMQFHARVMQYAYVCHPVYLVLCGDAFCVRCSDKLMYVRTVQTLVSGDCLLFPQK